MLNMKELTEYFLENKFLKEINEINPLGTKGKLVKKYASLAKNVWYGTQSVYSPWALKSALSQFAPMFSGYQHHDSQEFLGYLIDGIHEDLNRVKKKPIVEQIETDNEKDYEVAMMSWENHLKRNQSVIVDLLHGQYKSTIVCPDCKRISITFDPFNCVSLPIPDKKFKEIDFFYLYGNNKTRAVKMNLRFPKLGHTIKDLKDEVGKLLERDPNRFYFIFSGHTSKEVVKDESVTTNSIRKKKKLKNLFAFEIPEEDYALKDKTELLLTDVQVTRKGTDYFGNVQRKNHTFIRNIFLRKDMNLREVYIQAFKYFRFLFDEGWPESDKERWMAKSDEEAFKEVFDAQEEKPFRLFNVTNTRGFQECFFCGERRCENCPLKCDENALLKDILAKIKEDDHEYQLEFYFDNLPDFVEISKLNAYSDFNKSHSSDKKDENEKEPEVTIYDCFDLFRVPEQLGEENAWYCNKCKEHKRATKKMEIYKAPEVMMIHFKRFRAGSSILSKGKIGTRIEYPTTDLDVGKYVLNHKLPNDYPVNRIKPYYDVEETTIIPESPSTSGEQSGVIVPEDSSNTSTTVINNNNTAIIEETKTSETTANSTANTTQEWNPIMIKSNDDGVTGEEAHAQKQSLKYDLFGVVNHYGNMGFGHYTAYGFNHIEKKWFCFDDSSVNGESPNGVCTPAGYVLFYKRQRE
jgi:ubiquitin carboxyl-terminal hydrolase 4/11/15